MTDPRIVTHNGNVPKIPDSVFVADTGRVIGRVEMGEDCSVWFGAVLRGDVGSITLGDRTNIQDLTMVHVTTDKFDTVIGSDVTVGHSVVLHGCTVQDHVLVGMGAIVMDGAVIEPYCLIGAGALVTPGTRIPTGSLAVGSPARVVRELKPEERAQIDFSAPHYVNIANSYR